MATMKTDAQRVQAQALAVGMYRRSAGFLIPLRSLHDAHLINAYIKAVAGAEPTAIVKPLAREVAARGLSEAVYAEAQRREEQR